MTEILANHSHLKLHICKAFSLLCICVKVKKRCFHLKKQWVKWVWLFFFCFFFFSFTCISTKSLSWWVVIMAGHCLLALILRLTCHFFTKMQLNTALYMCRIPAGPHHPTPLCQKFTKHPPRNAPNFCCIEFYCSSYCLYHRPTQSVNLIESSGQTCPICLCEIDWNSRTSLAEVPLKTPCCRNSWFHNSCLQVINTSNLNETSLKSCMVTYRLSY